MGLWDDWALITLRLVWLYQSHSRQERWKVIIPEGEDVISSVDCIGGFLVVTHVHDVKDVVSLYDLSGTP